MSLSTYIVIWHFCHFCNMVGPINVILTTPENDEVSVSNVEIEEAGTSPSGMSSIISVP